MGNIIIPKHTAETVYFDAAMEVLESESSWVLMQDFTDKLYALLVKIGKETKRSSDNTHYTKCAQLPMYFGFVERNIVSGKTYVRINERGREFYKAIKEDNRNKFYQMLVESIESGNFGELNMGVPSSRSDVDPPALFIRASYDLEGLNNKEFAFLIWSLVDRNDDYTGSIKAIKDYRLKSTWDIPKEAQIYKDCKPIMILQRWGFLSDVPHGMAVSSDIDDKYHERLVNLKIYSVDRNPPGLLAVKTLTKGVIKENRLQLITYGAPGTGKSFKIKNETSKQKVFRTTFHPDSDYATFVGAYKPAMKSVERTALIGDKLKMADVSSVGDAFKKEKVIAYEFVEQVFTKAYIQAWSYQKEAASGEDPKRVYLVIEEINRGNCAQVFGDLFQLLDRNPNGFSDYAIKPDEDFGLHIGEKLAAAPGTFDSARKDNINALYPEAEEGIDVVDEVMAGRLMLLPDNLYIRATMNTSDQSLFPMDSAFKRRWDWDYVAIKDHPEENWEIEIDATTHYSWWDFLDAINKEIFKATSAEDKQLGYYFVRTPSKKIDLNTFVNKVVFYLWNSVFKDCYTDCEFMKRDKDNYFTFTSFFKNGELDVEQAKAFLGKLKNLKSVEQKKAEESSAENSAGQAEASGEQAEAAS